MSSYIPSFTNVARLFSLVSVLSVSTIAGLLWQYQSKLIYPSNLPSGARTDQTTPSAYQLPYQKLWLKTPDGEKLQAWFIRPDDPAERRKRRITLAMFQANAGNIAHRLPLAQVFYNKMGVNVFMVSYRGYGLSTGQPGEKGIKIDAQVALDWVKEELYSGQKSSRQDDEPEVILYGQSLGGAVAIDAAVRNQAWIKGLILENTFSDIPSLIPSVLPPAKYFTFLCREIWSSKTRLPLLKENVKVLFLSGLDDELVPPRQMKELYTLCKHKAGVDKEWKGFAGGTHNDTCMQRGYFPTMASWLHRNFGVQSALSREALSRGYDGQDEEEESETLQEKSKQGLGEAGAGSLGPKEVLEEGVEEIETEGSRRSRGKL